MKQAWEKTEEELGRPLRRSDFPNIARYETPRYALPVDVSTLTPDEEREWVAWSNWRDAQLEDEDPEPDEEDEEAAWYRKNYRYGYRVDDR